jgi:hypothetical protein
MQGLHFLPAITAPRGRLAGALALLLTAALLSTAMLWPFARHMADQTLDVGDTLQQIRVIRGLQQAWLSAGSSMFETPTLFPARASVIVYQPLYTSAALGLLFYALGWSPLAVFNALVWLSFTLSCWLMSLLAWSLTRSLWAAAIAGVGYSFSNVRWGHLAHLNLLSGFWMLLVLLILVRLWRDPPARWRGVAGVALALGLSIAAQALADVYHAVFLLLVVGVWALCQLAGRPWREQRRPLAILAAAGLGALLAAAPILAPTLRGATVFQVARSFADHEKYAARLETYAVPAHPSRLGYDLAQPAPGIDLAEQTLWPGLITLALAGLGLVALIRSPRRAGLALGLVALVAFGLSLGPTIQRLYGDPGLASWPYRWLYDALPLLALVRVPARWALVVQPALALLAAYGAAGIAAALRRAPRVGPAMAGAALAGLLGLTVADSWPAPISGTGAIVAEPAPAVYAALAGLPRGGLLEWPMQNADPFLSHRYMYYTLLHPQPTVNAAMSITPPRYEALRALLGAEFPQAATLDLLSGMGVRYINVNRWELSGWEALEARLAATPRLRLLGVYEDGRNNLYELLPGAPAAAPALADISREATGLFLTVHLAGPLWLAPDANYYDPPRPWPLLLSRGDGAQISATLDLPPLLLPGDYRWPLPAGAEGSVAARLGSQPITILAPPQPLNGGWADSAQLLAQAVPAEVRAGGSLDFRLYGKGPIAQPNVVVSLSLITDDGQILSKADLPAPPGQWPAEAFVAIPARLEVPASLAPGRYWIAVSLFDLDNNVLLPFAGPDGSQVTGVWRLPDGVAVGAP